MLRIARLLRRFADRIDPPEPKGYLVEPDWFRKYQTVAIPPQAPPAETESRG